MIQFNDIEVFFVVMIGICTFIVLLGNTIDRIKRWVQPGMDISEKLKEHDKMLHNDKIKLNEIDDLVKFNTRATFAMLDHMISGNDLDKMQQVKQDMNEYLISH